MNKRERKKLLKSIVDNYDLAQDYIYQVESAIDEIKYELEHGDEAEVDFESLYSDAGDYASYMTAVARTADELDEMAAS